MAENDGILAMEEFDKFHLKITAPSRLDEHRNNEAKQSFDNFYRREAHAALDQIITGGTEKWSQVIQKIKTFSIVLQPRENAIEELAERFCKLTSEAAESTILLAELSVLREE